MLKLETREVALVGLFAALTAVGAFMRIPLPYVPITLQLFFVLLAGLLLGAKLGALSQVIYMLIGLAGVPVFAEGGGPGYIFHPTFGFIVGFVVAAWVMGSFSSKVSKIRIFYSSLVALLLLYLIGITHLYFSINIFLGQEISLMDAAMISLVFVPGDIIKISILSTIGPAIVKSVKGASF